MKFLDYFKTLSIQPKNIKILREIVLQLAVQGKLTANWRKLNPNVSISLDSLSKSFNVNIDFLKNHSNKINDLDIPLTWSKVKFSLVFDIKGGSQPPKSKFSKTPQANYVQLFQIRDFGRRPQGVYVPKESVSKFCKDERTCTPLD